MGFNVRRTLELENPEGQACAYLWPVTALTFLPAVGRAFAGRADEHTFALGATVGADLHRHAWRVATVKQGVQETRLGLRKNVVLSALFPVYLMTLMQRDKSADDNADFATSTFYSSPPLVPWA